MTLPKHLRRADKITLELWTNATIILDVADPNYINALAKGCGVSGDMSTSDSGKTWTVTTINIPEYSFPS